MSCFLCFQIFFFLSRLFLLDLLEFVTFDKLYLFGDGSGSGSAGTCNFPFFSDEFVDSVGKYGGRVCGIGSSFFVPTII